MHTGTIHDLSLSLFYGLALVFQSVCQHFLLSQPLAQVENDISGAKAVLNKILRLNPGNKKALNALKAIKEGKRYL